MNKLNLLILIVSFFLINQEKSNAQIVDFPQINNWKISDDVQSFNSESLYEYINGAADLYIVYDFQSLMVATYKSENGGEGGAEIDVEVYDQENLIDAYGIYTQERPSKPENVDVGSLAYIEGSMLNFISGKYYVKIDSHDNSDQTINAIINIAGKLSEKLCQNPELPKILNLFPKEKKIENSDRFHAKDFLGHGFLSDVYSCDYEVRDNKYTLFFIKKIRNDDCEYIINKYLNFCKQTSDEVKEGKLKLSDRYNGEINLVWKNNCIWGILAKNTPNDYENILKNIEEQVKTLNN